MHVITGYHTEFILMIYSFGFNNACNMTMKELYTVPVTCYMYLNILVNNHILRIKQYMATITFSIMNTTPDSLATIPSQSSEKQFQSLYTHLRKAILL